MATEPLSLPPNFSSTPSPYITAPSSPKLLQDSSSDDPPESEIEIYESACSFVPFDWEEKPGKPKSFTDNVAEDDNDDDYEDVAFEFCVDRFDSFSLPAEELFDGGKIKPLKPPPRLQLGASELADSPAASSGRRSLSNSSRRMVIAWSSRRSYDFSDPFEAAIESARKGDPLCENETGKTASFTGSKRIWRLRNLLHFKFSSEEGGGSEVSKASTGFGSTGSSASGSSFASASVREPDDGYEVRRRSLTPCRRGLLSCFVKRL